MRMMVDINKNLLRLLVLTQVVLGVMIWMGNGGVLNAHIGAGFFFSLLVLVQGVAGGLMGAGWGLAGLAALWALLLPVIGLAQHAYMPGDLHWIVRVVHLLFGLAAMPIVERIAKRALAKSPAA